MTIKTLLRTGSAAAIAAALSFGALPTLAHAQDGDTYKSRRAEQREVRSDARQARQQQRAQQAPQQRTYQRQSAQAAPVAQQRSGRDWNRGDRRSDTGAARQGRDWNRSGGEWQAQAQARAQAQAQAQAQAEARAQAQRSYRDGASATNRTWERNRTYTDNSRNQTYRDGYRDGRRTDWRQDRQQTQNAYRSGYRDANRDDRYRDGRRDNYRDNYRTWSRDWRRDNRYNWYSYRNQYRDRYRLGRYYSPYSNYRYNRLSIGFRLGSLFYGSRYWINDPWQYRLPEAYGPYRWVRYYDDALLVNVYTGQVADVIYDFFW